MRSRLSARMVSNCSGVRGMLTRMLNERPFNNKAAQCGSQSPSLIGIRTNGLVATTASVYIRCHGLPTRGTPPGDRAALPGRTAAAPCDGAVIGTDGHRCGGRTAARLGAAARPAHVVGAGWRLECGAAFRV